METKMTISICDYDSNNNQIILDKIIYEHVVH